MLYPVYVHKDQDSAYGLTFPDFEGCFSAADDLQDLERMAQEAVELHFEGEDMPLPQPSSLSNGLVMIALMVVIGCCLILILQRLIVNQ